LEIGVSGKAQTPGALRRPNIVASGLHRHVQSAQRFVSASRDGQRGEQCAGLILRVFGRNKRGRRKLDERAYGQSATSPVFKNASGKEHI
jgi:hypothetical protein